ncbi:hypothetical protein ANO11243_064350 [Dothideomycetidae sp. 11243]|nr:hypothetical protein ANO11243_064350 [fungal sp. No.11243]
MTPSSPWRKYLSEFIDHRPIDMNDEAEFYSSLENTKYCIVMVGRPQAEFIIHLKHLRGKSSFFDAKLKEGGSVELPNDDPSIFDRFVNWLQHNYVDDNIIVCARRHRIDPLIHLYLFAHRIGCVGCKDAVMAEINRYWKDNCCAGAAAIVALSESVDPSDRLYKVLARAFAFTYDDDALPIDTAFVRQAPQFAASMLQEVRKREMRRSGKFRRRTVMEDDYQVTCEATPMGSPLNDTPGDSMGDPLGDSSVDPLFCDTEAVNLKG